MSDTPVYNITSTLKQLLALILICFTTTLSFAQNQTSIPGPASNEPGPQDNTFQPGNHCILWLKADEYDTAAQSRIPLLHDFSGQNHHAEQQTETRQPLFIPNAFGNKPAIRFDGLDDYLQSSLNVTGNKLTAFFILRVLSYSIYNGFITLCNTNEPQDWNTQSALVMALHVPNPGLGGTRNYYFYSYNNITNSYCNINSILLKNDSTLTFSNNTIISKAPSPWILNSNKLLIGARWENNSPFRFGNIEFGEIIIFDTSLSNNDLLTTYDYLLNKYSLPKISLGSDVNNQYFLCDHEITLDSLYESYLWSTGDTTPELTIQQSGTYWVQVKDPVFGFLSTDTVEVTMPTLNLPDRIICPGDSFIVESGFSGGYTFKWSDQQNDSLSGDSALTVLYPGIYTLQIHDSLGCILTDSFTVLIDPFSTAVQFATDTLYFCEGDSLHYLLPGGEIYQYQWNTGISSPGILLQSEGWYALTVTNETGCRSTDSVFIRFKGYKPVAWFSLQDSVCTGSILTVSDSSWLHLNDTLSAIQSYTWTTSMGLLSTDSVCQFQVLEPYTNILHLNITTTAGCTSDCSRTLVGVPPPEVYFSTTTGCTDSPVCFFDLSYDSLSYPQFWYWTFGDPASGSLNTDTDSSSCHIYSQSGPFIVQLRVENHFGCKDSLNRIINIHLSPDIGFRHFDSCYGTPVQFVDTTGYTSWNPCIMRHWDFGDSTFSTSTNPVHTFTSSGIKEVTLTSQTLQCQTITSRFIEIHSKPISLFQAADICQGSQVQFTNLSSVLGDTLKNCFWMFDTLTSITSFNPVYTFTTQGTYQIYLQVTSGSNCLHDTSLTIQVYPKPEAAFSYTISQSSTPTEVCFTNQSNNATSFSWFTQNTLLSTLINPCFSFSTQDTLYIFLIAENNFLCTDTTLAAISFTPVVNDISIIDYNFIKKTNSLLLETVIYNNGNSEWSQIYINISIDNKYFYQLIVDTLIQPKKELTLSTLLPEFNNPVDLPTISCITITNPHIEDSDMSNNTKCISNFAELNVINYYQQSKTLHFNIYTKKKELILIRIFSLDGKLLTHETFLTEEKNINDLQIDVNTFSNSVYMLQISNSNFNQTYKIVIK